MHCMSTLSATDGDSIDFDKQTPMQHGDEFQFNKIVALHKCSYLQGIHTSY